MTRGAARPGRWLVTAVACAAAAVVASTAAAQPLAVPYLPQTEDLCGGAAAAMVMRYWGGSDAYPDIFQPLVDRAAGGIRAAALTADLQRRGWNAVAGAGDEAEVVKELGRGVPVIALLEDRPGRFHYVVIIGWSDGKVVLHDPARAPSRVLDAVRFDTAWQKSRRWMLILVPGLQTGHTSGSGTIEGRESRPGPGEGRESRPGPGEGRESRPGPGEGRESRPGPGEGHESRPDPGEGRESRPGPGEGHESRPGPGQACEGLVAGGVGRAADDRGAARELLARATTACPGAAAAWRELAGLDALDANWTAAAAHARQAVALDARDAHAWRILATASYLQHDDRDALAAWNRIGEPVVNLVDVKGLERTRYGAIADAIAVPLKSVLTLDALRRGERRVRDVPSVAAVRVTFHPVETGQAQIDASVLERDRAPTTWPSWIRIGVGAVSERELAVALGSPTGGGDAVGAAWRWWEHRPMVSAFYAAPAPRALGGGVWRLDLSRETQTFGSAALEETRTRAGLTLGNWITDRTRVSTGVWIERWRDRPGDIALSGSFEHWPVADRVRLQLDLAQALGRDAYSTASLTAAARNKTSSEGVIVFGLAGYHVASDSSPASVWPGADTGQARDVLLRAHPLLHDGIIMGNAFGRRLASGTLEAQRWTALGHLPVRVAPAAFVDAARVLAPDGRLHVDAGAGLRLSIPGAGTMRIDAARGLRDGGTVLSAALDTRWR